MTHILHIDASMRREGSVTRALSGRITARFQAAGATVTRRDLADGISLLDNAWIGANFTDPATRTDADRAALAESEALVGEVKAADVLVIGVPIYNFGVPAAMKAWIDQICRARETFQYTENGPVGLLEGKRAIVAIASGGTAADSAIDFATPYMRHVLRFIGITDVDVIAADSLMADDGEKLKTAEGAAEALAL
ncbi:MAG: NAD(P)H-dependent oxidoreductase [Pseudomonadota bacterium]